MKRAFAVITLALASVSACKKDEPAPAPPPQETVTIPVPQRDTAPRAPTPTTQAAAPATRSGGAPAAGTRSPAGAASTAGRDAEISQAARLYTVQVASFVNAASAQALQTRLRGQGVPVWTTPARVQGREYTRVRIGVATTTVSYTHLTLPTKRIV